MVANTEITTTTTSETVEVRRGLERPNPEENFVMGAWGNETPRADLERITIPESATHIPVHPLDGMKCIEQAATLAGFTMSEAITYTDSGMGKFATVWNIAHADILNEINGHAAVLRIFQLMSLDKSMRYRILCGHMLRLCSNECILSGQTMLEAASHKATKGLKGSFYQLIYGGIDQLFTSLQAQHAQAERLGKIDLSVPQQDHIIMELMRRGVVNPAGTAWLSDQLSNPEHDEFGEPNAFNLLQAVTARGRGRSYFKRSTNDQIALDVIDEIAAA